MDNTVGLERQRSAQSTANDSSYTMTDPIHGTTKHTAPSNTASSSSQTTPPGHSEHPGHDSSLSLADTIPDSGEQEDDSVADDFDNDDGEHDFNDNDSAFGGSLIGCDTDTLASYITDYRYENGRRYHAYKDGEYWVDCSCDSRCYIF